MPASSGNVQLTTNSDYTKPENNSQTTTVEDTTSAEVTSDNKGTSVSADTSASTQPVDYRNYSNNQSNSLNNTTATANTKPTKQNVAPTQSTQATEPPAQKPTEAPVPTTEPTEPTAPQKIKNISRHLSYTAPTFVFNPERNSKLVLTDQLGCHIVSTSGNSYSEWFSQEEYCVRLSTRFTYSPFAQIGFEPMGTYDVWVYDQHNHFLHQTCYFNGYECVFYEGGSDYVYNKLGVEKGEINKP